MCGSSVQRPLQQQHQQLQKTASYVVAQLLMPAAACCCLLLVVLPLRLLHQPSHQQGVHQTGNSIPGRGSAAAGASTYITFYDTAAAAR